jgi:ABC-2 type transport system ATP-binding protein/ribosome-dependent ATPase
MILLSARGASRRFGAFTAVDGVDLEVGGGEVVGLLGANGAGKTTVIRMLLGLLRPSGGEVLLFGEPPSRRARARIGYVPQGLGLYDDLTVDENLAFAARAFRVAPPQRLDPELEAARGELVAEVSLGLRRRLAFAAALGHHPELLVLDEPTSGVDALGRARLWDAIRSAAEEGGTGVLVTTHSMSEAEQCDRLVMLAGGRVVAEGTAAEIVGDTTTVVVRSDLWEDAFAALADAGLPVALVGTELRVPDAEPARVSAALEAAGVRAEANQGRATLEEAFVALAGRAAA